ncbi:GAF domain-containing protein [Methylobacillus sp. Pita2]|uniref:GAF domain-containing protein n=1 Tax=Methylobacillus sp. Pita2 TaxID=3383245 RepID=UPI0038B488F6
MFNMPVAAINMIGSDHVFFAASTGVGNVDMRRDVSFCAHAINQTNVMVVPDSHLDEQFHDNPLVLGPANLRFYAGVPLISPDGHALGALCVIDGQPREFSGEDCERLRELAKMAVDRLELRRLEISTEQSRQPFEEFARNSPTAVVWFDAHRNIVTWNQAAAALHGYRLDEGEGLLVDQLIPEREHPIFHQLVAQTVTSGNHRHLRRHIHAGSHSWPAQGWKRIRTGAFPLLLARAWPAYFQCAPAGHHGKKAGGSGAAPLGHYRPADRPGEPRPLLS